MGRQSRFSYLLALLLLISGCSVQEPRMDEDISQAVIAEPEKEEPLSETVSEPDSTIPSVVDEVVDAQETPIDVAPATEPEPVEEVAEVLDEPAIADVAAVSDTNETEPAAPEIKAEEKTAEPLPQEVNATKAEPVQVPKPPKEERIDLGAFKPFTQQIGVLKIEIAALSMSIKINDPIIKYFSLAAPDRIVIDFKDIRYLEPKTVDLVSPYVQKIATAAHDNYNRVVIYLNEAVDYTISKESGGWLITFKK